MGEVRLVVHGHFYQPPRENPWTEEVAAEPSAAPFHDWNERITAECYRPNGWARVLDEHGRVTEIVDNYEHLSFDIGPTLLSWLETHRAEVYERMLEADRAGGGAIAQAYNHMILPLANERDVRTQIRWGLADFEHRFGRTAAGMWLPETAVNDAVLCALVDEGVGFTILAPSQADGFGERRASRIGGCIPTAAGGRSRSSIYDGDISHDLAFGLTGLSSQELIRRVVVAAGDGTPVCVATDGETFGHHHKFADRALAYAFSHEAGAAGVRVLNASQLVDEVPPDRDTRVHESAWSCAHGVRRWKDDCGCHTGGEPGWNQAWRAPLREALDLVREHGVEVFERRGRDVLHDPVGGPRRVHRRAASVVARPTTSWPSTSARRRPRRRVDVARSATARAAHVHVVRLVLQRPRRHRDRADPPLRGARHRSARRDRRAGGHTIGSSTCSAAHAATTTPKAMAVPSGNVTSNRVGSTPIASSLTSRSSRFSRIAIHRAHSPRTRWRTASGAWRTGAVSAASSDRSPSFTAGPEGAPPTCTPRSTSAASRSSARHGRLIRSMTPRCSPSSPTPSSRAPG